VYTSILSHPHPRARSDDDARRLTQIECRHTGSPHYKTNSRIIRRIIRFGLVLELSGW